METKQHCKRCPRCNNPLNTVLVHGHEECVSCHQVIDDCCQGECATNYSSSTVISNSADLGVKT